MTREMTVLTPSTMEIMAVAPLEQKIFRLQLVSRRVCKIQWIDGHDLMELISSSGQSRSFSSKRKKVCTYGMIGLSCPLPDFRRG